MSNPSQSGSHEEKEKYETITAQFWPNDLAQLRQLIEAGKNRESIGLYTAREIADELLPLIDPAVQTLARLGYPVHPYPVGVNTLLEMMARLASTPVANDVTQQPLHTEVVARSQPDTQLPGALKESISGERLLPSKETFKRLNVDEEGTV